jgi:hypothetical protein
MEYGLPVVISCRTPALLVLDGKPWVSSIRPTTTHKVEYTIGHAGVVNDLTDDPTRAGWGDWDDHSLELAAEPDRVQGGTGHCCRVLLKPSEYTPTSALIFTEPSRSSNFVALEHIDVVMM